MGTAKLGGFDHLFQCTARAVLATMTPVYPVQESFGPDA